MAIELQTHGELSIVLLDRPETKNSLKLEHIRALAEAIAEAAQHARCLLLMGKGAAFCAGRDLKDVDPQAEDTYAIMTSLINPLLESLCGFPAPTVAAVRGPALGLGLGLACSCDIVLAAEDALFGSPFRNFGGVTDSGGHYFLARRLGVHRAAELIFTGRLMRGSEAAALGLVNRAVPAPLLEAESLQLCREIATGPTSAFKATKHILATDRTFAEVLELEARYMDAALRGPDGREGLLAFREKRPARFTGE